MIDERDLKIINILRENARTPHTEIAARLGVAESLYDTVCGRSRKKV